MKISRAFTLIELLITLVVIGVLVTLALPLYRDTLHCRYHRQAQDTLDEILKAEQIFRLERGTFTTDLTLLPMHDPNAASVITYTVTSATGDSVTVEASYLNVAPAAWSRVIYEATSPPRAYCEDEWPCGVMDTDCGS